MPQPAQLFQAHCRTLIEGFCLPHKNLLMAFNRLSTVACIFALNINLDKVHTKVVV